MTDRTVLHDPDPDDPSPVDPDPVDPLDRRCPQDIPCRTEDAELWFAESPHHVEAAKSACLRCPVMRACLAGATARREPWGVWGGQLFSKGEIVARKRPRGRPRKDAAA